MRLDATMTQRMDQKMILAPRMIQSMEILKLPIMALQERIQQELQENPVLELAETDTNSPEEIEPSTNGDDEFEQVSQEMVIDDRGDTAVEFDRLEAINR